MRTPTRFRPQRLLQAAAFVGVFGAHVVTAQMAQDPLLSRITTVHPNLVFMFDDSGSMTMDFMYQYGGQPTGYGMCGPGSSVDPNYGSCISPGQPVTTSPDVNLIYYDPRFLYETRIKSDGTFYPAGNTATVTSFPVYFHRQPATTIYKVDTVTVTNMGSGYPATGVIATFSSPPAGVSATGTVTVGPSKKVQSVAITNGGANYPTSGSAVTFSAPSTPGGMTATGTPQIGNSSMVNTVTVSNGGSGYPTTPGAVTVTFSAPSSATGITATGTVTTANRYAVATGTSSTTITTAGQYGGTPSVTFSGTLAAGGTAAAGTAVVTSGVVSWSIGGGGGSGYTPAGTRAITCTGGGGTVQATGTATVSGGKVTSVAVTTPGSGYTSNPTCTVAAPGSGATLTATRANRVTAINVTTAGAGYTAAPTVSFSGGSATVNAVATVSSTVSGGISAVTVTNPGAGYSSAPTLTFSPTGSPNATATASLTSTRVVTGVNITSGGSGYTTPPTVTFTGGSPNATGTTTLGDTNAITGITVIYPGSGYLATPTITLSGTSGGAGAAFTVNTVVSSASTAAVNAKWNGLTTAPTTFASYFTPSYVPDAGSPLATGANPAIAYPNTASAATAYYPKFQSRSDCANAAYCTWAEERQNYANWYTYHRTRLLLAQTGVGLAFQPLNPNFRLGWGTINGLYPNSGTPKLNKGVRIYNSTVKDDFLTWLYGLGAPGSTPNRGALNQVGKYFTRSDDNGPWADSPNGDGAITSSAAANKNHASCRRSAAMLMTDGYYNDNTSATGLPSTAPDVDSTSKTVTATDGTYLYPGTEGPYSDTINGTTKFNYTFADVAMNYWATDLRPDLANSIKAVTVGTPDPAFWQHLNFYAIGLGILGTMDPSDPGILKALTGTSSTVPPRTLNWPQPVPATPTSIDDMWHATVNGRGKMLSAKNSLDLKQAITGLMADIGGQTSSQAGVAVSTANLKAGTKKYTPEYTSVTWNGNVRASYLNSANGNEAGIAWQVETPSSDAQGKITYSSLMPAAADRNIYVGTGATSGVRAEPFKFTTMSSTNLSLLSSTATSGLVDFLRGDSTNEDTSSLAGSALYRHRVTRLGDVVNSTPVFVKDTVDLSYEKLPSGTPGQSSYRAYVDGVAGAGGKKQRTEGILFVGANDGMLHGFRDGIYSDTSGSPAAVVTPGGVETFAYVPKALLPSLAQLSDKGYTHRYYVDGPLVETDAYFTASTPRWANVIVGSTGGGAGVVSSAGVSPRTAIFAIDVTSINSGVNTLDATKVLWEISSSNGNSPVAAFAELGYVLTEIQTGTTLDGQWVAIFGNGYESKSCQASLFVVNLETGALIREIKTGVGSCTTTGVNGLGGVHLVLNKNQQIIGAYAGDLQGNLWKFSFNDANPSNWKVDLGGAPLYTGAPAQPITGSPNAITLSAATSPDKGYMVVFGTGKFFELADITSTATQYVYGIWDAVDFGASTIPAGSALTSSTTLLVDQNVTGLVTGADGNDYYTTSVNEVKYTDTPPKRGWKFTLPNTGERLVYPIPILEDKFIIAETVSPTNTSLDPCQTTGSGVGFKYVFNGLTGASPNEPIFDTDGNGAVDSADLAVSGYKTRADGRDVTLLVDRSASRTQYVSLGADSQSKLIEISCKLRGDCVVDKSGAVNSRQWRQLFPR